MNGLIIDSSSATPFAALLTNKIAPEIKVLTSSKELAESVAQLTDSADSIDYIAVGCGPGSYTGTRAGVALAKSLAFAKKIPLYTFPSPLAFCPPREGTTLFALEMAGGTYFLLHLTVNNGIIAEVTYEKDLPLPTAQSSDYTILESHPITLASIELFIQKKIHSKACSEIDKTAIIYLR